MHVLINLCSLRSYCFAGSLLESPRAAHCNALGRWGRVGEGQASGYRIQVHCLRLPPEQSLGSPVVLLGCSFFNSLVL